MSLRYEQKKIVNETTRKVYNPKDENDMKKLCYDMNDLVRDLEFENTNLQERNNNQKQTIEKQQDMIDNYIDIKAKLNAKITEYETKAEEYELSACSCGSKHNWIKKTALEEFKEEVFQ